MKSNQFAKDKKTITNASQNNESHLHFLMFVFLYNFVESKSKYLKIVDSTNLIKICVCRFYFFTLY